MRKTLYFAFTLLLTAALTLGASAKYPSSGVKAPEGSTLIEGKIIGEEIGWDGTSNTGCNNVFDGDIYTYYDPTSGANPECYAGLELKSRYILTKAAVMPRESWTARFDGAMIQGSNDGEKWVTLWQSKGEAESWDWQIITDFKNNTGYGYYRYCNDVTHGDVAEVELYGYQGSTTAYEQTESGGEIKDVVVQFEIMEGVKGAFEPVKAPFGGKYPEISYAPTRDGYVFGGWYTTGGVKVTADTTVTNPEAHTLYARWLTPDEAAAAEAEQAAAKPQTQTEASASSPVPAICITVSVLSVIAACAFIFVKRRKNV